VSHALSETLAALAHRPDHSEIRLSEIVKNLAESSKYDWVFRVEAGREDPTCDYVPEALGGEWEAVLFHDLPPIAAYLAAWRAIMSWSVESPKYPDALSVSRFDDETDLLPPETAFSMLRDDANAYQVRGYVKYPFPTFYGESHDWLQVWFTKESTLLIVDEQKMETGYSQWDFDIFFLYRELIENVASALGAGRFLWGSGVDNRPESDARPISALTNPADLWQAFSYEDEHHRPVSKERFVAELRERLTLITLPVGET
jgi:hypothetical protein